MKNPPQETRYPYASVVSMHERYPSGTHLRSGHSASVPARDIHTRPLAETYTEITLSFFTSSAPALLLSPAWI